MILLSELRPYVARKKEELAGVNFDCIVVKKDEIVKFLTDRSSGDNQIMMVLMPSARSNARNEDNVIMNNAIAFLFLEKTEYSALDQKEWLDIFERTQETAVEFAHQLIDDISTGECSFNRFLDPNSMSIEPVSDLSSCNGWGVEIYFNTPF